ncbi:ribosomal protein RPL35 [Cardiosporidium cionae]|uniref:Ribosomal protein RPL35 n=1 Tax=Cardiosporidium cionae TaxID=476202 RepID=A0ABQ7JC13_9APIC|nr:ribosomal protein RPL35 [Cardiosporidium cionae]|eukprot:KAF8821547.1 ribosomal protein RPL35 [Cardiosporidium cionae]
MGENLKPHLLRLKSENELLQQLEHLKHERAQLRVAKVTGNIPAKLAKMRVVRNGIARVLTVYNEKKLKEAKDQFRKKRFKPIELRPKKTRALRRGLSKAQKSKKTLKERKKLENLPRRKFALKATL